VPDQEGAHLVVAYSARFLARDWISPADRQQSPGKASSRVKQFNQIRHVLCTLGGSTYREPIAFLQLIIYVHMLDLLSKFSLILMFLNSS